MDEMKAFDQQLASVVQRRVGPSEPVDDLAVFEAVIAANRAHGWGFTMLSALKFIAAGVIVALFGGFLLAGVLTVPQREASGPAAQADGPSDISYVEMTLEGGIRRVPPTIDESDGFRSRGAEYELVYETDDPRISGSFTMTQHMDGDPVGASLVWGTMRIENDSGSWEGPFTEIGGYATSGSSTVRSASLAGAGDYEGYTLYLQLSGPQADGTSQARGIIYEGHLP